MPNSSEVLWMSGVVIVRVYAVSVDVVGWFRTEEARQELLAV